ncbi:ACP S-malonyltransferase [Streptomyces hokutonensis]|uniref:Malonyl CoA-acyl carrier protein transacylase n=1 Tax=Streptomyces hokutonensis TaxID=1306990 RepID=A0ABW6M5L2_9ACTN
MTIALLFPGQGTQHIGMGKDLFTRFPDLTELAEEILGYSLRRLCLEDPDGVLGHTRFTQPAVYTVNALAHRRHVLDGAARPDVLLGHSLGEYNALEAAGVFDFGTGLRLVAERARLMDATEGGMAAVSGIDTDRLEETLRLTGSSSVHVAALNTHRQAVLAGPKEALSQVVPRLCDVGACTVTPLKVSGPFHTLHMSQAAEEFAATLMAVPHWHEPAVPVIANHTARPHGIRRIVTDLTRQIDHPVLWAPSIERVLDEAPDTTFIEIGGNTTLLSLVRQVRHRRPSAPLEAR